MATEFPISAKTGPAVKDIDQLINALRKAGKEAGMTEKEINDIVASTKKMGSEGTGQINSINKQFNNLVNDGIKKAGTALLAVFAFDKIKQFIGEVIKMTAEFQKFEAVLTNTLGSKSIARMALKEIADFAAKTPFSVQVLTENFIKLANRGLVPTMVQMRGLGDLSATLGKDISQVVEALLDVNNPERWKELGIVSQTAGDKVKLSFRGITLEADRTVEGVTKAAVALGEMEGVAGSMAAVSETLGGQISNLGDSWDAFLVTLGQGNKGILKDTVSLLSEALAIAKELVKTDEQRLDELVTGTQSNELEYFKLYVKGYGDIAEARKAFMADNEKRLDQLNDEFHAIEKLGKQETNMFDRVMGNTYIIDEENKKREESKTAINNQIIAYQEVVEAIDDYIKTLEKSGKVELDLEEQRMLAEMRARQNAIKYSKDNVRKTPEDLTNVGVMADNIMEAAFHKKMEEDKTLATFENAEMRDVIRKREHDKEVERIENIKTLSQGALDFTIAMVNTIAQAKAQRNSEEIAALQQKRYQEIEIAGDNEAAKEKIRKNFDQKEKQLKKQQAIRDQNLAVFSAIINIAQGVTRALGSAAPPINFILAALVGAAGAYQLSTIKQQAPRGFAEGVYDLEGPGTSTSDSIPTWLSRGESVVPENRHSKFGFLLKEIIEDPTLELWDVKNMIDQKLPTQYKTIIAQAKGADSPEMLDELRKTRQAIENQQQLIMNVDENGFQTWAVKGEKKIKYANSRYQL